MKKIFIRIFALAAIIYIAACSLEKADSEFSAGEGKGGSMARFTIVNNYLYTVDDQSLKAFDITQVEKPLYKGKQQLRFGIETIFPFQNKLFLGTTTGMYIFDVSTPESPKELSFFGHVRACDPVVTDGEFAYVTLNNARIDCGRTSNELQVIDIADLQKPKLIKQFPLVSPKGLAVRNDSLWVCDDGIKLLDISDKTSPKILQQFKNLSAFDVILNKNLLLVIGESGFTQYRLSGTELSKISEIAVTQ